MSTWADKADDDRYDDTAPYDDGEAYEGAEDDESYDEELEQENRWANAETFVTVEEDDEGVKYEVTRKRIRYTVDREINVTDLRSEYTPFGRAVQKAENAIIDAVSREPPLALEMGTADQFDRAAREDVKRIVNELGNVAVNVTDPHLAIVAREMKQEELRKQGAAAGARESGGGDDKWGGGKGRDTTARRAGFEVRVSNVSDEVTEKNLIDIFSANNWEATRAHILTDKETGNSRGFAYVTFSEEWMMEAAIKKHEYRFKNVVMHADRNSRRPA